MVICHIFVKNTYRIRLIMMGEEEDIYFHSHLFSPSFLLRSAAQSHPRLPLSNL